MVSLAKLLQVTSNDQQLDVSYVLNANHEGSVPLTSDCSRRPPLRRNWTEGNFKELYSLYVQRLRAYVLKRVKNHHDAEDLTAFVFCQALTHLPPKDPASPEVAAWLFTSARNAASNHTRRAHRTTPMSMEQLSAQEASVEDRCGSDDLLRSVFRAVEELTPAQREAVLLRFLQEKSTADLARMLGRTEGSARVFLHRAVSDLRRKVS